MKPWDAFLPSVLPYCPGCPDMVAEDEVRNAAEEFLAETHAWRFWTTPVDTVANQKEYTLVLPEHSRAVKLHEVLLNGEPLAIDIVRAGDQHYHVKASMPTFGVLTLGPDAPGEDLPLSAHVSLSLKTTATGLPDELFDAYRMAIAEGAIARLCMAVDKPYTNPARAAASRSRFDAVMASARFNRTRGNSSAPQRVRGHFF